MGLFSFIATFCYILFLFILVVTTFLYILGKYKEIRTSFTYSSDYQLQQYDVPTNPNRRLSNATDPLPAMVPRRLSFSSAIPTPMSVSRLPLNNTNISTTPVPRRSPYRRVTFSLTPEQQRNEYLKIALRRRSVAPTTPRIISTRSDSDTNLNNNYSTERPYSTSDRAISPAQVSISEETDDSDYQSQLHFQDDISNQIEQNQDNLFPSSRSSQTVRRLQHRAPYSSAQLQQRHRPIYYQDMISDTARTDDRKSYQNRNHSTNVSDDQADEEDENFSNRSEDGDDSAELHVRYNQAPGRFSFGRIESDSSGTDEFLRGAVKSLSATNSRDVDTRSFQFSFGRQQQGKMFSGTLR